MLKLRRWLLAPLLSSVESQAAGELTIVETILARLTEMDHRLISIARTVFAGAEQRWPTTVCLLWSEERSSMSALKYGPTDDTDEDTKPKPPRPSGCDPRSASICAWLAAGESAQLQLPLFKPIPRGAWLVSLGTADLTAVHVANQVQDMGGSKMRGRVCVLGDPVELGMELSITLAQPAREAAYR